MSDTNGYGGRVPPGEPRLLLPFLAPFYNVVRDLSYPLMRLTLGGLVLFHAFTSGKLTGKVTIASFATTLAKRGLEPSVPLAYLVFFSETIAAVCLIVGFFTRFCAAAIAIELAVITFAVYWPQGFHFAQTKLETRYRLLRRSPCPLCHPLPPSRRHLRGRPYRFHLTHHRRTTPPAKRRSPKSICSSSKTPPFPLRTVLAAIPQRMVKTAAGSAPEVARKSLKGSEKCG